MLSDLQTLAKICMVAYILNGSFTVSAALLTKTMVG